MTYEPDPRAQPDIEATEWIRSRTQQRQALVENQMQMLLKEVRSLKQKIVGYEARVQDQNRDIFQLRTALEGATTMMNEFGRRLDAEMKARWGREEIETVCAWCGAHTAGPTGAALEHVSHGICPECLKEQFPEMVEAVT
jgi:DNA repair exonuclease SbcCD ATPase subunit